MNCTSTAAEPREHSDVLLRTDPVRQEPIPGIHLYAMIHPIEGVLRRGKSLKTLYILLLVWIAPAVLLLLYLLWTSRLLPRLRAAPAPEANEPAPGELADEIVPAAE